jgi:hypothetical protein
MFLQCFCTKEDQSWFCLNLRFSLISTVFHVGGINTKKAITLPGYGYFSEVFVNIVGNFEVGTIYLTTPNKSQKLPIYYMIKQ